MKRRDDSSSMVASLRPLALETKYTAFSRELMSHQC
jgi:hypothetical protein